MTRRARAARGLRGALAVALVAAFMGVGSGAGAGTGSAGTLESSFGAGGIVYTHVGQYSAIHAMTSACDGRIIVVGHADSHLTVARYNVDGSLDESFGQTGVVTGPAQLTRGNAVAVQPDGKILVAGQGAPTRSTTTFALSRLNADGTIDPTFGVGGVSLTDIGGRGQSEVNAISLMRDGRIVAAGYTVNGPKFSIAVARYLPNGLLDPSFGAITTPVGAGYAFANSVVVTSTGRVVVGGGSWYSNAGLYALTLVAYLPDGALDPSFGTAGVRTVVPPDGDDSIRGLALTRSGQLYAATTQTSPTNAASLVALRFDAFGAFDSSFGTDGYAYAPAVSSTAAANAVSVDSDGDVLVAGTTPYPNGPVQSMAVARFTPSGVPDTKFGNGGLAVVGLGTSGGAHAMMLGPDGMITVGGYHSSSGGTEFALVRLSGNPSSAGATETSLISASTESVVGEQVSLSSAVRAATRPDETPGGAVTLLDGGTTAVGLPLDSDATASFDTTALSPGAHQLSMRYCGEQDFLGSVSTIIDHVVNRATSTVDLQASTATATFGDVVTLTATVSVVAPGAATPTGNVHFLDGSVVIGVAPVNSNRATLTTNELHGGTHRITAAYDGDSNLVSSTSAPVSVGVTAAATTMSAQPALVGVTGANAYLAHLVATLLRSDNSQGVEGQLVRFTTGSTALCTAITDTDGTARCDATSSLVALMQAGGYTASFSGSRDYGGSNASAPLTRS